MTDHYSDQRAEGAAISTRLGGGQPARGPGVINDLTTKLAPLIERVATVSSRLHNLGDRAYGESPNALRDEAEVRQGPPYSGAAGELFYTIDRLEEAVSEAERAANRVDGLA